MLQKSERTELKRAVELYGLVRQRLEQIREGNELINSFWRTALRRYSSIPEQNEELEDLKAHTQHLQAMISRLRGQPLLRLKSWIGSGSVQYALGYAIAVYCVSFVLLWLLAFTISDEPAWMQEFQAEASNNGLLWYPFDQQLFYRQCNSNYLCSTCHANHLFHTAL